MSEQKSRLSIEIDSSQAVRDAQAVTKELIAIKTTGDFAAKSVEGTSKSINHFSQEGTKGASSAKILSDQVKSVGNSSRIASDGISKVTQSTAASAASMDSAAKAAQALASRIAAIATVGAAVSKMDAFSGYENRLKLVTTSQTELNQAMNDTFRIAQASRQDWDSVVQVYQRFSDNAKTLGIDMKKTAEVTETVAKAVAISGASAASAEAALTQFGQALASGVLRGEELNSVMEQTPGLSKAIAQGMGITIGQLRSVAAEGKITSEVLINALTKSKDSVDELFGKTSMTIGQSMTYLNNEVTKFVGEAGKGSGAANALASSIKLVGDNLDVVTSGAILAGIGYVTMAIAKQGDAVRVNMATILAKQVANRAELSSQVAEATATLNTAKAHLANVQATNAEAQAKYGATAAALRYSQAQAAVTVATNVQTAAQARLTATTLTYQRIAAGAWSLIGGPIGLLTIGVTGLAASYMYMSGRAEEATAKIKQQGEAANKTADELKKLEGRDRALVESDLAEAFEAENKKLKELNFTFNAHVIAIQNAHKGNVEIANISNQVRQGIISQEEAIKRLNTLDFINPQQFKQLKDANFTYDEQRIVVQRNADAQGHLGTQVELTGNKASNAQGKNAALANSHDLVANAANREAGAQQELAKQRLAAIQAASLGENTKNQRWMNNVNAHGGNEDGVKKANFIESWLAKNKIPYEKSLSAEESKQLWADYAIYEKRANLQDKVTASTQAQAKADREKTKELEKQNKLLSNGARLVGISGDTGIGRAHVDIRYGGSRSGNKPTAEHINRIQAGGKPLQSYKMTSGYGPRNPSDPRASKDHKGIDYAVPKGTPLTTKVAVKSIDKWWDEKGGGFVSTITFEDGVVLKLLHQSKEMMSKVSGGASEGKSNSLTLKQQESLELKDARESESLSNDYRTITEKDAADHQKRMTDLRKHGLTKEMEMEKARYEKTKELRALEQTLEIDGWRWVGEEKIKNDAAVNRLRIEASTDLSKTEKGQAIESNKELMNYELSAYRRLQHEKMKEFRATIEQQATEYQGMYYDALAKASMIQPAYARWDAQNSYGDQMGVAWDNKQSAIDQADEKDSTTDQYLNDANTRNQMYLEAEKNYQAALLAIKQKGVLDERELQKNSFDMQLEASESVFGSMTEMLRKSGAERTGIYRAMLVAEKGAAIARSIIAIQTGIAEASANPFPYNIGAMASVAAATASIVSNIQAVSTGFSGGGFTGYGGKYDLAGTVHKGEVVWSQDDIKRWGGPANVDAMRQSSPQSSPMIERQRLAAIGEAKASQQINVQPQITINTPPGVHVETSTDVNGGITIDIVRQEAKQATKDSWGRVSDYNSFEAKQVVKSFSVSPRR